SSSLLFSHLSYSISVVLPPHHPSSTLFPYTTLFRSLVVRRALRRQHRCVRYLLRLPGRHDLDPRSDHRAAAGGEGRVREPAAVRYHGAWAGHGEPAGLHESAPRAADPVRDFLR